MADLCRVWLNNGMGFTAISTAADLSTRVDQARDVAAAPGPLMSVRITDDKGATQRLGYMDPLAVDLIEPAS